MTDCIVHRGPDDEGMFLSGNLGLGFRRLSIIDLQGGHQPMSDLDESVWVVFNGEIYNFQELKQELESYGHVFRTRSDTEVIVYGYKQWGIHVLDHLNGMFGLAIWDVRERQLMLARDRMGIKLIYFRLTEGQLAFSSEIRPLLTGKDSKPEIDPLAVSLFLRYRYTPSPLTVLKGIQKLAPGTRLIVREDREPVVERWWNFKPEPFDRMPSDAEAADQLLGLYQRAVKRQLISDVPVGLLLSGGLDSGLLLALMRQNGDSWKTYSVGYGASFAGDELTAAARTAELLQAPNVSLEISRDTFEASLPKILAALEEPVAASSIVPMYHICERARQDVKVAFVGQGPDELFGGYIRHFGIRYGEYWRTLPGWTRKGIAKSIGHHTRKEWVRRGLYTLEVDERLERYQRAFSLVPSDITDALFRSDVLDAGSSDRILDIWRELEPLMESTDELGGLQFLEIRSSLPDELLMYADKLSMAHSLEIRVPYLDQDIVQYVERLKASYKIRRGTGKWLHRQLCNAMLPSEILNRKKQGFAVNVVDDWFRNSLSRELDDVLLNKSSRMYAYLEPGTVARLLQEHRNGQSDNHKVLFSLVALEHSLRGYGA